MSFILPARRCAKSLLLGQQLSPVYWPTPLRNPGSGDTLNNKDQDCEIDLKQKTEDLIFLQVFVLLNRHTALFYRNQL